MFRDLARSMLQPVLPCPGVRVQGGPELPRGEPSGSRTVDERTGCALAADRQAGSGTVLALGLIGVLLIALVIAMTIVSAYSASGRARAAADLGAIAAAGAYASGQGADEACRAGLALAARNRASPVRCALSASGVAELQTQVPVQLPFIGQRLATATARAGPRLVGAGP